MTDNAIDGVYRCAACGLDLFDAAAKFDAGAGWPSFTMPIAPGRVTDHGDGAARAEARCARCDSHLGHLFADGPPPTGARYSVNSIALEFRARPTS